MKLQMLVVAVGVRLQMPVVKVYMKLQMLVLDVGLRLHISVLKV